MQRQSRPLRSSSRSDANITTSAVGTDETYGRRRARRMSLYTRSVMWITILICVALFLGTMAQAWSNDHLMHQVQKAQQTLQQLQKTHQQLQHSAAYYNDPGEIESEARQQLGYVRPGEQSVVIVNTPAKTQLQKQASAQPSARPQGYWFDWLHVFFGHAGS
ncbi:MAG TPA: septum formation initiator family protein [Dictyobacter sp.]|nr:septum formation initiator family protein [Dictyobacter sp.]